MSLARRQLNSVLNMIIRDELQKGIVPTVDTIISRLNKVFSGKILGMPTVRYRPATYRGRSNPSDWNATVEEIHTDLTLLYEENLDQINAILSDFNYSEVERRKLERQIGELEDRIENLLLLNTNAEGYLYSVYDDFRTLDKIDLDNTTAWIDLSLREVTPAHTKVGNVKADIVEANVSFEASPIDIIIESKEIEPLKNILDDNINTSWIVKVTTSKKAEVKGRVRITFNEIPATRVSVSPHFTQDSRVEVRYTEDGMNWRTLISTIAQERIVCDFSELELVGLELVLSKAEPDEIIQVSANAPAYVYYFGIVNVSVLKMGFEDIGILQSKRLDVLDRQGKAVVLDKISLDVVEEVPVGSSINYYIALDEDPIQWQPIAPIGRDNTDIPKVIDLKSLSSTVPVTGLVASGGLTLDTIANGLSFYQLSSVTPGNSNYIDPTRTIIKNNQSLMLYKGIDQFRQESYMFEFDTAHEPTLADWLILPASSDGLQAVEPDDVITTYRDVAQTYTFTQEYYSYRLVTSCYFTEQPDPVSGYLKLSYISGADPRLNVRVYLNGIQLNQDYVITPANTVRFQWPFVRGWNTIMVLIYKPNAAEVVLDFGFTLTDVANKTRAQIEAMTYVSYFDLLYNIPEKDVDKYSLNDDNVLIIGDYQKQQGARYEFYYKYYVDTSRPNSLKLKAELARGDDKAVAPKLKSYRIRVS